MNPVFFSSGEAFRAWLKENHDSKKEIIVGFHRRQTGKLTLTWKESVDEALSFGWIDSIRRSIDSQSYTIRFTPRKKRSIWSAVNIKRAGELIAEGRMQPAGLKAFKERDEKRANLYSFERENIAFDKDVEKKFKANKKAWKFFQSMPPSYRKPATWWVMGAKKAETRNAHLATLIEDSEAGKKIKPLSYGKKK